MYSIDVLQFHLPMAMSKEVLLNKKINYLTLCKDGNKFQYSKISPITIKLKSLK